MTDDDKIIFACLSLTALLAAFNLGLRIKIGQEMKARA